MKHYCYYDSPIGKLLLAGTKGILEQIHFPNALEKLAVPQDWLLDQEYFHEPLQQLAEYFAGKRQEFDLKFALHGTPFQQQVWQELCKIPFGETASYLTIAERLGKPKACRAVGMANGRNPLPIIIPCHRIIGKDGSLTGFGGGLAIKQQLLNLEQREHAD